MNIKLNRVRLSFPHLFRAHAVKQGDDPKFGAAFLLDKERDKAQIAVLREGVKAVAKEQWSGKIPKGISYCIHDGSEKDYDGYGPEVIFINASSNTRVPVVDKDPSIALAEEDGRPYAGCFVNVSLRLWAQDNNWGKRINAQLKAVQFAADGDAFGAAPVNPVEEFENVEDHERPERARGVASSPAAPDDAEVPF